MLNLFQEITKVLVPTLLCKHTNSFCMLCILGKILARVLTCNFFFLLMIEESAFSSFKTRWIWASPLPVSTSIPKTWFTNQYSELYSNFSDKIFLVFKGKKRKKRRP